MRITKELFGHTKHNEPVFLYCLKNTDGSYVEVLDYGCRIRSICVPDRTGGIKDICLGYQSLAEYENDNAYFGAAIGRCTNLIANAYFTLNETAYRLDKNDGNNHLHGGKKGFSFCLWNATVKNDKLIFMRTFPHMSDGYPGNLTMQITYEWTKNHQLHITYEAMSDRDTILNVTNHTYFNLNGSQDSSIQNHNLWINSDKITEVNSSLLPTGRFISVSETPFDFRILKSIGSDIDSAHLQLVYGCGYDHNFILKDSGYRKVATLHSPLSGIRMTCYTDQPGIQIYTANGLDNCIGKYGETLGFRSGICMETQHYTNAINIPEFPSIVLKANVAFHSKTTYTFDTLPLY